MSFGPFWIEISTPGRLAIITRPRGGDWLQVDAEHLRSDGFDTVISLLTPEEMTELGLEDEKRHCARAGLRFVGMPVEDRQLPAEIDRFLEVATALATELQEGRTVAIHCRQGIGRSALMATAVMVALGISSSDAIEAIETARGTRVPDTQEQRIWAESLDQD